MHPAVLACKLHWVLSSPHVWVRTRAHAPADARSGLCGSWPGPSDRPASRLRACGARAATGEGCQGHRRPRQPARRGVAGAAPAGGDGVARQHSVSARWTRNFFCSRLVVERLHGGTVGPAAGHEAPFASFLKKQPWPASGNHAYHPLAMIPPDPTCRSCAPLWTPPRGATATSCTSCPGGMQTLAAVACSQPSETSPAARKGELLRALRVS